MRNAIETKNLTKVYKNFTAVNSLNLKVPEKSIFGLLGPNGAGKTTTIKMLTCLIQPTSGHASVGGYDVQENPNEVRNLLGMVPQQVSLYKDLTVQENSELCADYYGVPVDEKYDRIEDLMELVDIKYARNKRVGQLSGGQKQKASLVASLVHRPEILFLDEPTIGLDPTTKRTLWDLIRELNDEGNTIILCSHDMHEVDMLCDNVGIINTGNLVAYDTPQGLKDSLLKEEKELNFIGSVEAREIPHGQADVIVTEAFSGNVILKLYEGVGAVLISKVKEGLMSTLRSKIGALLIKPALKTTLKSFDASEYGGAPLLGLNGLVVKTHGSSKAKEVSNTLIQCVTFKKQKINEKIKESIQSEQKSAE